MIQFHFLHDDSYVIFGKENPNAEFDTCIILTEDEVIKLCQAIKSTVKQQVWTKCVYGNMDSIDHIGEMKPFEPEVDADGNCNCVLCRDTNVGVKK